VIPQVPGTIARSKRVKGVFEVLLTSKKYMWPIFLSHPYAAGTAIAIYVQHWHFNPGKNALILDAKQQLGPALTRSDRSVVQDQLKELFRTTSSTGADANDRQWMSLRAAAEPGLDDAGRPILQLGEGSEVTSVGVARSNILSVPAGSEFAAGLVKARLRAQLKSDVKKIARSDIESDLVLLQQLLAPRPDQVATTTGGDTESRSQSGAAPQ
jgi:hypothetical protein